MRHFIDRIDKEGITPLIIKEMIQEHQKDRERMKGLYERYKTAMEGVPVLQRTPIEYEDFETGAIKRLDDKVNNRLNNAFDVDIVDTKVGYMFGHAISYETDKGSSLKEEIDTFNLRNNAEDKDSEWGKKAAICGYGARIAYIDREGQERVKNLDPWETIILSNEDMTEPKYALRYYKLTDDKWRAEFYDAAYYHIFNSGSGMDFTFSEKKLHTFDHCPLFGLPNNEELMADAEKVLALIDAYDRTLSDASNEIEQYRLAYLIFKGLGADEETLSNLNKTGIFELFDEKDDIRYLTKDINDQMIENHLDRLEENILRFAKSVNFSDESFAGNITGVAMRFKLLALENKCITMERKMTAALRYQFKVLCSAWEKRGICSKEDYLNVWFGFKRNLPANMLDEAQSTAQLKGLVSEKTRLSLLSFVDDVNFELEEMQKEALLYGEQLEPLGGDEDEPAGDPLTTR
ncbi:phage portal protein [Pseudobacillus sp. 179-B 2D1 NHS]|uniref:phage portal protein n=1 Tax=Pseudobacillus sp. 179-B 2D1 NHS TaxID=3374292 RepID=UPI003879E68A